MVFYPSPTDCWQDGLHSKDKKNRVWYWYFNIIFFGLCNRPASSLHKLTKNNLKTLAHFRKNLYGREFVLLTGLASLKFLLQFKNSEGQLARSCVQWRSCKCTWKLQDAWKQEHLRRPCPRDCSTEKLWLNTAIRESIKRRLHPHCQVSGQARPS